MRTVVIVLTAICFLAAVPAAATAGESKAELQKKFEARLKTIQAYKEKDKLGETNLGYIEALKEEYLKDKKLDKIIKDENGDREKLYEIMAKELSTDKEKVTAKDVGTNNVKLKLRKAGPEEYFKCKDGKWRRKKEMVKKKAGS